MKKFPKILWVIDSEHFQIFMLNHLEGDVYILDDRKDAVDYESYSFSLIHPGYLVFQGHKEVAFNSDEVFKSEKAAYRGLEKILNGKIKKLVKVRNNLKFSQSRVIVKFTKEIMDEQSREESSL